MAVAVRSAISHAGLSDLRDVPTLRVVNLLSWRYRDPARYLAEALGWTVGETALTTMGGNSPQALVNLTAAEIQAGELDLAVLAGGECWRTRTRAKRQGQALQWSTHLDHDAMLAPDRLIGDPGPMSNEAETARGIVHPVQIYPMFETTLRAAAGESLDDHRQRIAALWARFAAVAATNPQAWVRSAPTAEQIATPGPENRMIGLPYPKLMNSHNDVDQAAALVMCSVGEARRLGVAPDRWVFPIAGADAHEHEFVSDRHRFDETPAIRLGGRCALDLAGIGIDDIDLIDLYSCFPAAVQLGAASLGLGLDRQLTRTGGMAFAGGPWNDYVMHAIATVVGELRAGVGQRALVWANGGFATKHSFGIYSTAPPTAGFRTGSPQAEVDALPRRRLAAPVDAAGPATIEAYTVMHGRDGEPEMAIASCLLADGRRAWGTNSRSDVASALCDGEWVGRQLRLTADGVLDLDGRRR